MVYLTCTNATICIHLDTLAFEKQMDTKSIYSHHQQI